MIERLNSATNLLAFGTNILAFLLVVFGGCIALRNANVGTPIITGAFGIFVGFAAGMAAARRITDTPAPAQPVPIQPDNQPPNAA